MNSTIANNCPKKTPKTRETKATFRIDYTKDVRGVAIRRSKEVRVTPEQVEKALNRIEDAGGYNIEVRCEADPQFGVV